MAEVYQFAHVKQTKHKAVFVHDAGNKIEGIDGKKERGEPKRALLNRAESLWHGGSAC
jgi:hypothetical protein